MKIYNSISVNGAQNKNGKGKNFKCLTCEKEGDLSLACPYAISTLRPIAVQCWNKDSKQKSDSVKAVYIEATSREGKGDNDDDKRTFEYFNFMLKHHEVENYTKTNNTKPGECFTCDVLCVSV